MLTVAPSVFARKGPARETWVVDHLQSRGIREVAVLPAAVIGDDRSAARIVESAWVSAFDSTARHWSLAREREASFAATSIRKDSLLDAIAHQVFGHVSVDPATAYRVTRLLKVQALLCVRVNRWERVPESTPDRPVAIVELEAAMVDSTGATLWKASGSERQQVNVAKPTEYESHSQTTRHVVYQKSGNEVRATTELNNSSVVDVRPGVDASASSTVGEVPPDFAAALGKLLERWSKSYASGS
jgi:hypothetical protein